MFEVLAVCKNPKTKRLKVSSTSASTTRWKESFANGCGTKSAGEGKLIKIGNARVAMIRVLCLMIMFKCTSQGNKLISCQIQLFITFCAS